MSEKRRPSRRNDSVPFYEAVKGRTSAQVISEARTSIRALETSRPFTPANASRSLLSGSKSATARPPSVYSIGQRHFIDDLSRPESSSSSSGFGMPPRLAPIESSRAEAEPPPPSRRRRRQQDTSQVPDTPTSSAVELAIVGAGPLVPRPPPGAKPGYRRGVASGGRIRKGIQDIPEDSIVRRSLSAGNAGREPASAAPLPKPPAPTVTKSPKIHRKTQGEAELAAARVRRDSDVVSLFNERIRPFLDMVDARAEKSYLYGVVDQLYGALEETNMLGKGAGRKRSTVLKAIFKLLDVEDDRLLLKVSRLILAMNVTGNNLTNVCKLMFKLSKTESNDLLFYEEKLSMSLLHIVQVADPVSYCEALVYCIGTLKLLSGNSQVRKELADKDAIQSLSELTANLNKLKAKGEKTMSPYTVHLLVQVTATLRNLADVSSRRDVFVSSGVIVSLCPLMDTYKHDADLMLNVSRILSKVSQHLNCKSALSQIPTALKYMLNLLSFHISNEDLVVRICFVLGNLTIRDDTIRTAIFYEYEGMDVFIKVFDAYANKSAKQNGDADSVNGQSVSKSDAVLVKLIRVIANLSVNPDIGCLLACSELCIELLMQVLANSDPSVSEELVLNAIATINNLSYYDVGESVISEKQLAITDLLINVLLSDNMEIMAEAFRVFGNLSRSKEVRALLASRKVDQMMVTVLDSGRREIVYSACGVLVNMMADVEHWQTLQNEGGAEKLTDVLRDFGRADWHMASLVGKIFSNYCRKMTSSSEWLGENEALTLMNLLSDLLDESTALSVDEDLPKEMQDFARRCWKEDFCPVARKLLAKIEACYSDLEPL
eukprot:m.23094 g.23094  ORF g.23094 m.23094 type:complete len:831 (+) comp28439_c0_seq1:964-3456(+)